MHTIIKSGEDWLVIFARTDVVPYYSGSGYEIFRCNNKTIAARVANYLNGGSGASAPDCILL